MMTDKEAKKQLKLQAKEQKKADADYKKALKHAEQEVTTLVLAREKEIERIKSQYWTPLANGAILYSMAEGNIIVNNMTFPFSAIKGAQVNAAYGARYISTTTGKTKKRPSIGKAVIGGAVFGATGAIIGGVSGKSKTKSVTSTNEIPTCTHIGVQINLNGFVQEAVLLNGSIDQNTRKYVELMNQGNDIVSTLIQLANTPVPQKVIPVEQYPSVLEINKQINDANIRLSNLKA